MFANGKGSRCAVAPEPSLVAHWVIVSLKAESASLSMGTKSNQTVITGSEIY